MLQETDIDTSLDHLMKLIQIMDHAKIYYRIQNSPQSSHVFKTISWELFVIESFLGICFLEWPELLDKCVQCFLYLRPVLIIVEAC